MEADGPDAVPRNFKSDNQDIVSFAELLASRGRSARPVFVKVVEAKGSYAAG